MAWNRLAKAFFNPKQLTALHEPLGIKEGLADIAVGEGGGVDDFGFAGEKATQE